MTSILDLDFDYFNLVRYPAERLRSLLSWADRPVTLVVEEHHKVLPLWERSLKRRALTVPSHILHVDEHHDMMNEKRRLDISNVMYHAMVRWPTCWLYWMPEGRIDGPGMWLEKRTWRTIKPRFRTGKSLPHKWPKPDIVSVCTSPEFVSARLRDLLAEEVNRHQERMKAGQRSPTDADVQGG